MRLVSRAVPPLLVCLALAIAAQATPCCVNPASPTMPTLRVLVPDYVAERWYACRRVAEEDLGITIALNVMPTTEEGVRPPLYPIDVMREAIYQMIDEDNLPDMAMIPRDLAREISDRCYVYDLDAFECALRAPFYYDGAVDGIALPWATGLVIVFFEPGKNVVMGLSLISHPVIASQRLPEGCCDWPPPPPEPVCCPPCGG